MIDGSKRVSITVWLQAFHTKLCFILCLLNKANFLQQSLYLFAKKLYQTWKMNTPNRWCFFPNYLHVSSQDLMPEGQSASVVKWLPLALQGRSYPFLIFFRNCHHTETSSCEACVPSLQSEIQKSFSRCLLVRYCECAKLNKIIVVS